MSEETARLVDQIRSRIRRATRRLTWAEFAFGGAVAAGSLAALWLVAVLLEAFLWLGPTYRMGLLLVVAACVLGLLAVFVARPLGQLIGLVEPPPEQAIAEQVGANDPSVADRLVNVLQLAEGRRSHAPAPFVDRAVEHLADQIDEADFNEVADFQPARLAARWATVPVLAGLVFLLAAPSTFLSASGRLLAPGTEFDRPAPFRFSVAPGNADVVQGDSLRIEARTTGSVPGGATLLVRDSSDDEPERIHLEPDSAGIFRHTISGVRSSFRYRVVASPVRTDWYSVRVISRPFVRRVQVKVVPPPYTGRSARTLPPNVGSVTALPGAQVHVSANLGGPAVTRAALRFEKGEPLPLSVEGDSAWTTFTLRRNGSYVLGLRSNRDVPNRDPIRYETSLQTDAPPSASFIEPTGSVDLTPDLTQQLRVRVQDDYGIRAAKLFYRRTDGTSQAADSTFSSVRLPVEESQAADQELRHRWLLAQESNLNLERGDAVAYYVKVWDNDTVNGPKAGRTVTQHLRFPSLSEQYDELDETKRETGEQMRELERQSTAVQQQFDALRDELRRTRQADWEDRRQLERIREQQKSVGKGLQNVSRQVEQMNRQMQRNDLSSPETRKKFEELKRTVDDIKSEELQTALERLRKSMKKQNFPQMQRRMNSAQSQLRQRQDELERTLNLFKQLKARQKLDELTRRAETVQERQNEIAKETDRRIEQTRDTDSSRSDTSRTSPTEASADSTSRAGPDSTANARQRATQPSPSRSDSTANDRLAREQERTAEEMEKLMESMKEAETDMEDVSASPQDELRQLNKQLNRENLPGKMRKNSQTLRKNQLRQAQRGQQQIQKQLRRMQSQLSGMQQQMNGRQRKMNVAGLRAALENTLRLSQNQETLRQTVEPLSEGPAVREYAPKQKHLVDGLKHVADSLQSIASRVPRMSRAVQDKTGNALRAMEKATSSLDEREANQATEFQKTSMRQLNELALLLSELLNQMQQQSGGGGGSMSMQQARQQLQQAAGQQQKLNRQIQEFLNKAQGSRLSADRTQRRKQLAEQQRRIRQQLEEMNLDRETRENLLGDLEKIAEQMGTSADDLQRGARDNDLLDRQQQILTRLLNAQQSLRTQGKKEERRGRTAESDFERERPGDRPPSNEAETLRRDLIRALRIGYNSEYEDLIKRYFELLEAEQSPEE